jgi:hypothetical protein
MQWIPDIKYNNWKWMVVLFEVIGQAWQGFAAETNLPFYDGYPDPVSPPETVGLDHLTAAIKGT